MSSRLFYGKIIRKINLYMRTFAHVFLLIILVAALGGFFGTNVVFAKEHCKLQAEDGESIPSTFPVGDCLTTEGQKSFVPTLSADKGELSGEKGIGGILVKAINLLTKIIASIALVVFIIGALLTVTSEGKEDRLEKGKTAMLYAIIGLLVAFFSFIIVTFVQSVLF